MPTPRLTRLLNRLLPLPPGEVIRVARREAESLGGLVVDSPDHLLLALACMTDRVGLVRKILERRPELLNARCAPLELSDFEHGRHEGFAMFDGMPPLSAAIAHNAWKVGAYLLSLPGIGLDPLRGDLMEGEIESPDWTPLLQLAVKTCTDDRRRRAGVCRFAAMVTARGANPMVEDQVGNTALSLAILGVGGQATPAGFHLVMDFLDVFVPRLPQISKTVFPGESRAEDELLRRLEALVEEADSAAAFVPLLQRRTHLPFDRIDELVCGHLYGHGLHLAAFDGFVHTRMPVVAAYFDQHHLQSTLPDANLAPATVSPRRLRL